MAITVTELQDSTPISPVLRTFDLIGKDRVSSEWINSEQLTADYDNRLTIKQRLLRKNKLGVPVRQSLVQFKAVAPTTTTLNGSTVQVNEEFVVNLTITAPIGMSTLTTLQIEDNVAFLEYLLTDSVVQQLLRGEV